MRIPPAAPDATMPGTQRLDAELKFCHCALEHGNTLAMQGQLTSATRDVWLIADAANAVKRFLAGMEDADAIDRLNTQLAEVQRGLNDLRKSLDMPPEAD